MEYILLVLITAFIVWQLKPNAKDEQCEECKQELENRKDELKTIVCIIEEKANEHKIKQEEIESLKAEIKNYESDLDIIECGFYETIFDYDDEEDFKEEIKSIRADQKWEVKHENVIRCSKDWKVGGSEAQGRKLVKQYGKIMLRAFNSECDTLISKVRFGNVTAFVERMKKSHKTINKFGELYSVTIHSSYLQLKLKELQCTYEHERLKEHKKEEARTIREQMKQEQAEAKALEVEKKKAEAEEAKAIKELQNASKLLEKDKLNDKLKDKIEKLKLELEGKSENVRKISQSMITRAGHVYIISNPSFNVENRFKIGVTRRLDPQKRVDELSNASVPFRFDVHAMVYSENAMELENKLHKAFDDYRVNKSNSRKEFFDINLHLIEKEVKNMGYEIEMIESPVNLEYSETLEME